MWGGDRAELVDPALAAAVDHEHGQAHLGAGSPSSCWFYDENAAGWTCGLDASSEDAVGVLDAPVVEDVAQQSRRPLLPAAHARSVGPRAS